MADQQGNFLSKFVPKSHFFTDPDTITQTETQAFGPASTEEFRVTSSFNIAAANANAYAICKGIVLVQPQAGSTDKVNLVLRPYTQPIQGVNIKYFIYRGLKLSDFFNGTLVKAAGTDSSDLVNSINSSFTAFHTNIGDGTVPDFLAKYIGFDPVNQADALPLSDFFFKQSDYVENNGEFEESGDTAFELPTVAMGATLGTFAAGECGIDDVLDYGDYQLPTPNDEFNFNLAYARAAKASISTAAESDRFKKKIIREQIFQFLDVAAYFGFHAIDSGSVILNDSGTKLTIKGQEIYDLLVSKFFTRNRLYLYIQSDRTRSYNFYENYNIADDNDNCLKMGISETSLTERKYETSGWPLIIDESIQSHDESLNTLYLQLVTDNNVNTMLYGQVAQIANAQSNNFCGPDNLRVPNEDGSPSDFVKVIALVNPATAIHQQKFTIATFNFFLYQGVAYNCIVRQITDDQNNTDYQLLRPGFFDDVFDNLTGVPSISNSDGRTFGITVSQRVKLVNHYFDQKQYGISAIQTAIVTDSIATTTPDTPILKRVIYLSENIDVLNQVTDAGNTITGDTKSSPSLAGAGAPGQPYNLPDPFYYQCVQFTDNDETINGLKLMARDGTIPSKIILGLTQQENDLLKGLLTPEYKNGRLFLLDMYESDNILTSPENVSFQRYRAAVTAEKSEALEILMPASDIIVYALDRNYHFSEGYSRYMPADNNAYFTPNLVIQ